MADQDSRLEMSAAPRALAARTDPEPFIEAILDAILAEVWPDHGADPALMVALRASVTDNVTAILGLIAGRLQIEEVPPPADFAFTDLAVNLGIPVSEIEAAYWLGMTRFWRRWFVLAGEAAAAGEGRLDDFVGAPTETLMQHLRHVVNLVVARYAAVSESIHRSNNDRRRLLVAQVVDGEPELCLDDIESELGYAFAGTHLGLVLQATERLRVEQLVAHLADRVKAHASLLVLHGADTWICWLRFPTGVTAKTRAALQAALQSPHVTVTAGEPGVGIAGFRRTRGDAVAAAALRRRFSGFGQFLWFRDVSLELCLLSDEKAARRFMEDELGELNGPGERLDRARETLLAWLETGSSSAVAARLFLHENTVRMRVNQAQELLSTDLRDRRAEVLAALRLRTLLSDPV